MNAEEFTAAMDQAGIASTEIWDVALALAVIRENQRRDANDPYMQQVIRFAHRLAEDLRGAETLGEALMHASSWLADLAVNGGAGPDDLMNVLGHAGAELHEAEAQAGGDQ